MSLGSHASRLRVHDRAGGVQLGWSKLSRLAIGPLGVRLAYYCVAGRLERAEREETTGRIVRKPSRAGTLGCGVSVTLDDGSRGRERADIEIARGERCLSSANRREEHAGAGDRWPLAVGHGEILIKFEALFLMPQKPYVPLEPCAGP